MVAKKRRETKVSHSRTECLCVNQIVSGMVRQEAAWIKYDVQSEIQQERQERSKGNAAVMFDSSDIIIILI